MGGSIEHPNLTFRAGEFRFRPMTTVDLPVVFGWLHDPEIAQWWGEPPATVGDIEGKYTARIDGSEAVSVVIVERLGNPFALLQWYRLRDHPDHPAVGLVPAGYAALDVFIGDSLGRNQGFGRSMLSAFLREAVGRDPTLTGIAIDPAVSNKRAIAAYRAVGFEPIGQGIDADTGEALLVMAVSRESFLGRGNPNPGANPADAEQDQSG
jgi:aminoglycoside 6'-N-acetyltransferase